MNNLVKKISVEIDDDRSVVVYNDQIVLNNKTYGLLETNFDELYDLLIKYGKAYNNGT